MPRSPLRISRRQRESSSRAEMAQVSSTSPTTRGPFGPSWPVRIGIVAIVALLAVVITHIVATGTAKCDPNSLSSACVVVSSTVHVGDHVPHTGTLGELSSTTHAGIASLAQGHPYVLNFFGSYCSACAAELHNLATVANSETRVRFIGIDADEPRIYFAATLLRQASVNYPILEDVNGNVVTVPYGVGALPATFFVNADGIVVHEVLGYETVATLRADLANL